MKKYYGNYLGLVVNGSYADPENRNRLQIWVPHVTNTLYLNWNSGNENGFEDKSIFDISNGALDTNFLNRIRSSLPWAECASPLIGRGSTYYRNEGTGTQSTDPSDGMLPNESGVLDSLELEPPLSDLNAPDTVPSETPINFQSQQSVDNSLARSDFDNSPPIQQSPAANINGDVSTEVTPITVPRSFTKESNLNTKGADMNGLNPFFRQQLELMADEYKQKTGNTLNVQGPRSAFRTFQEQQQIRREYPDRSASPGTSQHGYGGAIDLNPSQVNELKSSGLLSKYGFWRPYDGTRLESRERQHIELVPEFWDKSKLSGTSGTSEWRGDRSNIALRGGAENGFPIVQNTSIESSPSQPNYAYSGNAQTANGGYDGTATGTYSSPDVGAKVWVFFMGGDIQKPIYFAMSLNSANYQQTYQSSQPT